MPSIQRSRLLQVYPANLRTFTSSDMAITQDCAVRRHVEASNRPLPALDSLPSHRIGSPAWPLRFASPQPVSCRFPPLRPSSRLSSWQSSHPDLRVEATVPNLASAFRY